MPKDNKPRKYKVLTGSYFDMLQAVSVSLLDIYKSTTPVDPSIFADQLHVDSTRNRSISFNKTNNQVKQELYYDPALYTLLQGGVSTRIERFLIVAAQIYSSH